MVNGMNNTQATAAQGGLHPVFAGILAQAANVPVQIERAQYVSRLCKMDWGFEQSSCGDAYRRGKAEFAALKALRDRIDPGHELWNRHAPEWVHVAQPVHTFRDFTGKAPVLVEWMHTPLGPRMIAVVVETSDGPHSIQQDLSPAALKRYQDKVECVAAQRAGVAA